MTTEVTTYFKDGCGRCSLFATAACKVNTWRLQLSELRALLLTTELVEECKWGVPCYTYNSKNVIMLSALKDACTLSFFKGVLMEDPHQVLVKPGENSQIARYLKFTAETPIEANKDLILAYINEAIQLERDGRQIKTSGQPEPMPDELIEVFEHDLEYEAAFRALTPGRQRGYILFFSQAKQSTTRQSRIAKVRDRVLAGLGMHD